MLYVVDYNTQHWCPINYDVSRGEKFGKLKITDNSKLTNKQKHTLNFEICIRVREEDIADQVSILYHDNIVYFP